MFVVHSVGNLQLFVLCYLCRIFSGMGGRRDKSMLGFPFYLKLERNI